jgi:hypothetical protein
VPQQIRRFGIGQTAKVVAVLYALMGLVFAPIILVTTLFSPKDTGLGAGFAIAMPILYGVCGFIFTAIGCAIYNLVASWVGGVEVEFDVPSTGA